MPGRNSDQNTAAVGCIRVDKKLANKLPSNGTHLKISVDDVLLVEVIQGGEQFGGVKSRALLCESLGLAQVIEQRASVVVVGHKVKFFLALRSMKIKK